MFAKTKHLKKIIFAPAVVISALLTSLLFFQFGTNYFTGSVFVLIGLSIQVYQIMCLLEWKNSLLSKRKKYFPFVIYIIITISSCIASIVFGIKEIDKKIADENIRMPEIERLEKIISSRERAISDSVNSEYQKNIRQQIKDYQKQIPNLTYKVAERAAFINREIERLNRQLLRANEINNDAGIIEIEKLKVELAIKRKSLNSVRGAFSIIAFVLGVDLRTVLLIFLFFVTVSIELMIYSTSNAFEKIEKKHKRKITKIEKERKAGQISFLDRAGPA